MIKNHATMSQLWRDSIWRMWRGTLENKGIDFVASIDTIAYDNLLAAESMEFDLNMGRDLWLNKARWTRLLRDYLDPRSVEEFIERSTAIGVREGRRGVVTQMPCAAVVRRTKRHRWGNCMLGFTYRGMERRGDRPTLGMHSRVSYIAYIGGLDLAVAYVLAREIGSRIGAEPEEFKFRWHVDALQFHGFKSIPMLLKHDFIQDLQHDHLRKEYPTIKLVGRWYDQIVRDYDSQVPLEDQKYGPLRRVRRRYSEWHEEDFLPTVTVKDLTLAPIGL